MKLNGEKGKRGAIGICPRCGKSDEIVWSWATDVSKCKCGWSNALEVNREETFNKLKHCYDFSDIVELIDKIIEENERLNVDLEAMRCAANSYKMHCEKLSEEILNAFEQGQKQATARAVGKMRDKLRDVSEFNLRADNRGALYYIDLQAWVEEIEVELLRENK